ncbi:MAG: hypothetical protein GX275_06680 [Clostridiales bacterium]|nr:hypothetical protein [Clostridiales bacterium]
MLYEYEIKNNLSMEKIENILKKSKVIKRNLKNIGYLTVTISAFIILLISFILNKFKWNNGNLIIILSYVISMSIVLFSSQKWNIKRFAKRIEKMIGTKHNIEIKDNKYIYSNNNFTVELFKERIAEMIIGESCILILFLPNKFKHIIIIPTIIPKYIFKSKEELNEFINRIS